MSPILTRPVREQLEHDRVIRQLQARYKRKNEVVINPGNEQNQSITVGELVVFPDLLLFAEGGRRLLGTVEVETGESVNAIEARAEWGVYSKLKVPLHLYVPPRLRRCRQAHLRRVPDRGGGALDLHDQLRPGAFQHGASRRRMRRSCVCRDREARAQAGRPPKAKPAAKPSRAAKARRSRSRPPKAKRRAKAKPKPKAKPASRKPSPRRRPKAKKGAKKRR